MAHRCAILDDYQNVATKLADWSIPDVEIKIFNEPFAEQKAAVAALKGFGKKMMSEHHGLRKAGQDLVKKLGVTPTPPAGDTMPVSAQKFADSLNALPKGAAWDKTYIDHEVAVHQGVL